MSAEQAPSFGAPVSMARPLGPLIIPERKEHVPEWCPWRNVTEASWHGDEAAQQKLLETVVWTGDHKPVLSNGVTVTVAHVLPERRYAIEISGRVKDVHQFNDEIGLKWIETFALAGQRQSGDASVISKPQPVEFVKWTVDPTNRERRARIGHDPLKPAPAFTKPRTAEDAEADPVAQAARGLVAKPDGIFADMREAQQSPQSKMDALERMHRAGGVDDAELAAGMRKIAEEAGWTSTGSGGSGLATSEEASPSFPASSASLTVEPAIEVLPAPTHERVKSDCGRTWKSAAGRAAHARRCRECIEIKDAEG